MILKEIRVNKGITQKELASLTGINKVWISKLETNQIKLENITLKNAMRLANVLDVTVEDLLER